MPREPVQPRSPLRSASRWALVFLNVVTTTATEGNSWYLLAIDFTIRPMRGWCLSRRSRERGAQQHRRRRVGAQPEWRDKGRQQVAELFAHHAIPSYVVAVLWVAGLIRGTRFLRPSPKDDTQRPSRRDWRVTSAG